MGYEDIQRRHLAERSFLNFSFPQASNRSIEINLPILENPEITENQTARYADYKILARPGNLFAYTGADSREFTLNFFITFPNVLDYLSREGMDNKFFEHFKAFTLDKETKKKQFVQPGVNTPDNAANNTPIGSLLDQASIHRKYFLNLLDELIGEGGGVVEDFAHFIIEDILGERPASVVAREVGEARLNKAINLILLWLNLVRASTLNNAKNSRLGPPIVRINHGPMYNNIPCIVESYNLSLLPDLGYDLQTFLPRRLQVQMTLKESRVGNFDNYKTFEVLEGDNLAGWEAIISDGTYDPYSGPWPDDNKGERFV